MFPMQQIPLEPNSQARVDGMGFFSCGPEDVPLPVGARREVAGREETEHLDLNDREYLLNVETLLEAG